MTLKKCWQRLRCDLAPHGDTLIWAYAHRWPMEVWIAQARLIAIVGWDTGQAANNQVYYDLKRREIRELLELWLESEAE